VDHDPSTPSRIATGPLNGSPSNPYWEVLNNHLCVQLKNNYPLDAISCVMQVVGSENPLPHDEPGYRSSIETIGDIDPLVVCPAIN
jgi:hypothetical protein